MFSGRYPINKDTDGRYFLDRDSESFRFILNYLRTGKMVYPDSKEIKDLVEADIDYFGLRESFPKPDITNPEWNLMQGALTLTNNKTTVSKNGLNGWDTFAIHAIKETKAKYSFTVDSINSDRSGYIFGICEQASATVGCGTNVCGMGGTGNIYGSPGVLSGGFTQGQTFAIRRENNKIYINDKELGSTFSNPAIIVQLYYNGDRGTLKRLLN